MRTTILVVVFLLSTPLMAQRTQPASRAELEAISARGKLLYEYDQAAWHASDALVASDPNGERIKLYLAKKIGDKWEVVFGKLSMMSVGFEIAYSAVQGDDADSYSITAHDPPLIDTGFYVSAARAVAITALDFKGEWSRYNVAILPADSLRLYVYHVPAQLEPDVFPLGSDARYLVSGDGRTIVEKRQLHKAIIVFPTEMRDETDSIMSGVHSAVLDEAPEDTDVFHVLARSPSVPEWIITVRWVYAIKPNGSAHYMMTTEQFKNAK